MSSAGGGATIEELKDVLRETLENRGALGGVRAHLRAEVSNALEDRTGVQRPDISNENLIINELIREYLVFNRWGRMGWMGSRVFCFFRLYFFPLPHKSNF